jgi:hypothetical protein
MARPRGMVGTQYAGVSHPLPTHVFSEGACAPRLIVVEFHFPFQRGCRGIVFPIVIHENHENGMNLKHGQE